MASSQQLILGEGAGGVVQYQISRSLRFNSADSAYLNRTPASAGNRKTWTWSGWLKRSALSTGYILDAGTGPNTGLFIGGASDLLGFFDYTSGPTYNFELITTQSFRDVSAWYHIVVAVDTTQATSSNRVKIYLNGSQITAFGTATYPSQNFDTGWNNATAHRIGSTVGGASYFNGYLADINFIDGSALTPSSFGETDTDTGVWKPKAYSGSYGTNGFYLKFADNSGTTSTTLGKDTSGNGNNWTPNNFSVTAGAGNDSLVDTPTPYGTDTGAGGEVRGNYATLNPLNNPGGSTFANGNLDVTTASSTGGRVVGTVGVSSGKWYWEITPTSVAGQSLIGIAAASRVSSGGVGDFSDDYAYQNNGNKYSNSVGAAYGASYVANDVIGVALDLDAGTLVFYKNNSSQGTAYSSISGTFVPAMSDGQNANSSAFVCNFGQRPFAYTAPSGFKALCTQNLPTPTIGATSATQAGKYFNTVLYTGTGSSLGVTGAGFQPDFVWIKSRSAATDHGLYDAVRGVQKQWKSNSTDAETTETTGLTAFNSDGFTVGSLAQLNTNTATYASWNWKANGAGSSNTAGSITSTVSANTTAGFSIVTYTGNGTSGATVGHGLGVAPRMMIFKQRSGTTSPPVYHASLTSANYALFLNLNIAEDGPNTAYFNNTAPSSTVFTLGNLAGINGNGNTFVAYCFAPVASYSSFGSYVGNGSSDGPFIYTGFRPRFILFKRSSASGNDWRMTDTARSTYNPDSTAWLYPNTSLLENANNNDNIDILSNGFKIRATADASNNNGSTFIYAAFAENPFKYSLAR